MSSNLSAIFYLISGILFILALRGLSSPETSRRGNLFGILGMIIAITVTFLSIGNFSIGFIYVLIILLAGGSIGALIAYKIPMTAMPELVAGFHSFVGLAAVFVAISAFLNPEAFNLGSPGDIKLSSLIEMSIGAAVGAITFSGSIIAFLKLRGIMSGSPIIFRGQHYINLILGLSILVLIFYLCKTQSDSLFWRIIEISLLLGFFIDYPNWRSRYASRYINAKLLLGMGSCRNRIYIRKFCTDNNRRSSRFFRSNIILYYVQRNEPILF